MLTAHVSYDFIIIIYEQIKKKLLTSYYINASSCILIEDTSDNVDSYILVKIKIETSEIKRNRRVIKA